MNFFKTDNKVLDIPILYIKPAKYQPRRIYDEAELNALSQSISQNGILQPLTVRRISPYEFELIAGERRLRAAQQAGFSKVPCIVNNCSDDQAAIYSLIENLQRSDLNMFEEARGIRRLITEFGITQEQAAVQLGKKQSTIANKLRLLRLSDEEQAWISSENLTERHARALITVSDPELRKQILDKVIAEKLNVLQTEQLIERMSLQLTKEEKKPRKRKVIVRDVRIFINTINKAVDTMRLSGIDAQTIKNETDEYIEYNVRIPKNENIRSQPA